MADSYQPTNWVDDSTPAINAVNLRKLEKGVADAHGIADATIGSTGRVDRVIINDGAGHYLQIPSLTTAQRDGLTAKDGMMIYNTTLGCFQARRGGAWVDLHAGAIRANLSLNSKRITDLADPIDAQDAVTRGFVAAHAGNVPHGAILQWPGTSAPEGWLECNGAAISRTTYSTLFSVLGTTFGEGDGASTFNLPDLRGEFVRGWDHGRGVDTGRVLGSMQADEFKRHSHQTGAWNTSGPYAAGDISLGEPGGRTTEVGGTETRPRNVALMYIIKV